MKNPRSVLPVTNLYRVDTYTVEGYAIDGIEETGMAGLALSPSTFASLSLAKPQSPIVTGLVTTYSVVATLSNALAKDDQMLVSFPTAAEILSGATACAASVPSGESLTCSIDTTEQKLTVTNQIEGFSVAAGTALTVNVDSAVRNPQSFRPSAPFSVTSYLASTAGPLYKMDEDSSSLTVTADTPNELLEVVVERAETEVNAVNDYSISFRTSNPVPSGAIL